MEAIPPPEARLEAGSAAPPTTNAVMLEGDVDVISAASGTAFCRLLPISSDYSFLFFYL